MCALTSHIATEQATRYRTHTIKEEPSLRCLRCTPLLWQTPVVPRHCQLATATINQLSPGAQPIRGVDPASGSTGNDRISGPALLDEDGQILWPPSWEPAAFVSDDLVDAYEAAHKKRK